MYVCIRVCMWRACVHAHVCVCACVHLCHARVSACMCVNTYATMHTTNGYCIFGCCNKICCVTLPWASWPMGSHWKHTKNQTQAQLMHQAISRERTDAQQKASSNCKHQSRIKSQSASSHLSPFLVHLGLRLNVKTCVTMGPSSSSSQTLWILALSRSFMFLICLNLCFFWSCWCCASSYVRITCFSGPIADEQWGLSIWNS